MIVLNVTYKCKPDMRDEFLEAIMAEGIDIACRAEEGNLKYDYYYPADGSDDLLLVEKWRDAEAFAKHGQQPHYKRLGEQEFGKFEGVPRDDKEYQAAKREYFARYPGGESYFDMAVRVYPLIKELEGKTALLVTHGGICRIIRSYFQDMGNEEFVQFAQGNCEVKIYG